MLKQLILLSALVITSISNSFANPTTLPLPNSSNDSISVEEIIKWRAEKIADELSVEWDDQSRYYLKHFKKKLKKATRKHPKFLKKQLAKTYLINEIKESDYHFKAYKNEESMKKVGIAGGVVLAVVLLIKMNEAISRSQ